jgi:hypothetical protein
MTFVPSTSKNSASELSGRVGLTVQELGKEPVLFGRVAWTVSEGKGWFEGRLSCFRECLFSFTRRLNMANLF